MDKLRIVEKQFRDGNVKYVLERLPEGHIDWISVYAHDDLEVIREAKTKRENGYVVSTKVIE